MGEHGEHTRLGRGMVAGGCFAVEKVELAVDSGREGLGSDQVHPPGSGSRGIRVGTLAYSLWIRICLWPLDQAQGSGLWFSNPRGA